MKDGQMLKFITSLQYPEVNAIFYIYFVLNAYEYEELRKILE